MGKGAQRSWIAVWAPRSLIAAVALFALASRGALIDRFGSDQPFHDQWGAEGFMLYRPWLHGNLTAAYFFFPHSEHRPAATRLLALSGFVVNGRWDARVQTVVNAGLYGLLAALATALARRHCDPRRFVGFAAFAAVLFALPANWENTLWGFQSQFYFLLLFGLLHVWGTCARQRIDVRWLLAQAAGAAALFTIAAGVASAATLSLIAGWEIVRGRRDGWAWGTLGINLALVVFAVALLPEAASIPDAHARSLPHFLQSWAYLLAWPLPSLLGLALALPWAVLLFAALRRRTLAPSDRLLVALGLWGVVLLAILAYGRGGTPGRIAIRYFDVILIGLFTNGLILAHVLSRSSRWPRRLAVAAAVWTCLWSAGAWLTNRPETIRPGITRFHQFFERQQVAVQAFHATNDPGELTRDPAVRMYLPHLDFTVQVLRDPAMRRRLPASLVPPPALSPGAAEPQIERGWASRLAPKLAGAWREAAGLGLLCFLVGATASFRRRSER